MVVPGAREKKKPHHFEDSSCTKRHGTQNDAFLTWTDERPFRAVVLKVESVFFFLESDFFLSFFFGEEKRPLHLDVRP